MTSLLPSILPQSWQAYARLARLDKPVGFMLLLYPAWFAQVLATPAGAWPDVTLFVLFYIGAVVMRAAGCAMNDVVDHRLDAQVERTKTRPIASGEIKPWQGMVFAIVCSMIGLAIVVQMGVLAFWLAVASLPLIALYPLMKRITWWPQVFLGIIFNWGALMGFAAQAHTLPIAAFILYAGCFFWTLAYDTIYAFQDIRDDEMAGIKSTARRLGDNAKPIIMVWSVLSIVLISVAGTMSQMGWVFYAGMVAASIQQGILLKNWRLGDSASSLAAFQANTMFGDIVLAAMILGHVIL
ncbi:MAG: 4-hydroxybenzoate octaprenyltransferase [Alphaproteobacteria bacterium]|nr:4-hydroxybenzoate octaprenyltransferase [Alphaproteobacteria bacterium]